MSADVFKCVSLNENVWNLTKMSLKCVYDGLMGHKSMCKKDITPLLTYWSYVFFALTHRFHVMACCLFSAKALFEHMMTQWDQIITWTCTEPVLGTKFSEISIKIKKNQENTFEIVYKMAAMSILASVY